MTTNNPDTPWVAHGSEDFEEADEPPELSFKKQPLASSNFQRTTIRPSNDKSSLLTKAIMGHSDDDLYHPQTHDLQRPALTSTQRRRSLASTISIASTADLTSDTGFTSPSRPSTPSPPLPEMTMHRLNDERVTDPKQVSLLGAAVRLQARVEEAPRKRSIQFACGGKPAAQDQTPRSQPMVKTPSAQEAPRRPCIKFACPARPASTQNTPPRNIDIYASRVDRTPKAESPSTPRRASTLTFAVPAAPQQTTPRRHSMSRPKFLRADSSDLATDGSQFHEFARGTTREDDWIRRESDATGAKLTINDTLTKENHIRRLATEAEEEALEEEEELDNDDDDAAFDNDEDDEDEDDDDNEDELDVDIEDDEDEQDEDEDSDGYNTDEETGFADSEEEDEDDDMALWTPSVKTVVHIGSDTPQVRRPSLYERKSDSSITTLSSQQLTIRREKPRRSKHRDEAPDLPDSTDFVCGTLDEDRPLEEAYLSCLAARRTEKLRIIPQDIDPSFPASESEDEGEGEIFNPVHHSSDEEDFVHGKMEDLHHERDRRRRKSEHASPKRFRSPPPKRHLSPPPPKNRGRSPKPLFDRHSPRKAKSPAPARKPIITPLGSPRCGQVKFNLAGRPGLTHTKSLPRAGAMCLQRKQARQKIMHDSDVHVRGAIDIVKGLESKRQRRKEKFHQKYCNRARRGQIPERKPVPGRGTERMRELGLLMAGKKDQGHYVISV
ncbi:hypothetical protein CDV31_010389 [Fusarium ambrosium]|uniref:Extensin domain-containing protein n=1 Tax=Fusarium ambrosium TaxID=131363 RepID=A0A428TNS4_9HYPO|nr:hypothetical protein CDV31_010389 [Fusarium ambrosium]